MNTNKQIYTAEQRIVWALKHLTAAENQRKSAAELAERAQALAESNPEAEQLLAESEQSRLAAEISQRDGMQHLRISCTADQSDLHRAIIETEHLAIQRAGEHLLAAKQ